MSAPFLACLALAMVIFVVPEQVIAVIRPDSPPPHSLWLLSMQVVACNLLYFAFAVLRGRVVAGAVLSSLLYNYAKFVNAHNRDSKKLAVGVATSLPVFALCFFYERSRVKNTASVGGKIVRILWLLLIAVSCLFSLAELNPEWIWKLKLWPPEANVPPFEQVDGMWAATLVVAGALRLGTSLWQLRRDFVAA
jgi:hypothetical protein